MSNLISHR